MDPSHSIDAAQLAANTAAHPANLSLGGLILDADPIVQIVMALLVIASIWSWAIIFDKIKRIGNARKRADNFEDSFWSGGSLDTLYDKISKKVPDPMAATFAAGMREWRHANERNLTTSEAMKGSLQQRIDRVMGVTVGRELTQLEKSMTVLASVGSISPFVGLFGTVVGIMHSFTAIANQQNTNLAVVAPGIAEALFATALGLVAAIPAVIAYNKFSTDIGRYADRLDNFSAEFSAILSRHLEAKT
jgi:biopolymer transport protein TolQ